MNCRKAGGKRFVLIGEIVELVTFRVTMVGKTFRIWEIKEDLLHTDTR